mgnify:CR=1 FL=1
MSRSIQRKKKKTKFYYRARLTVLAVIALFMLTSTWRVYQKHAESKSNLATATSEREELAEKEYKLRASYERIQSEKGKDEEIRKKFNVVKAGEEIAVIIDSKTTSTPVVEEKGFWEKLWQSITSVL